MRAGRLVSPVVLFLLAGALPLAAQDPEAFDQAVTQGALRIKTKAGRVVECPLRHTDVQAEISGFVARVKVTQTFVNPGDEPIEAVYVFPLPHQAAVDDMSMVVGQRRIVGLVKRRAEAREIYARALAAGQTASLLEQERPNIFTQTVGNIPPGQEVRIEISYVDVLAYDHGTYEFHFPMVVGPRYIPGRPLDREPAGQGWSPDTGRVPDASRITPPVLKPGQRTGHDISLSVRLEAGVPVRDLQSTNHESKVERTGRSQARVTLSPADALPNKDFVLRYAVVGAKPEVALLTHAPRGEDGYFLLMMQPRQMENELREAPPREICFLVDVSGSMSGAPTAKVVETMRLLLQRMRPQDRIQVVTFASEAQRLFPGYLPATSDNIARALAFTNALQGGGGTEMLRGIQTVLGDPVAPDHVRIVLMLTDGYIGNEAEIIREVARRSGDQIRFWAVGVGTSVNRYLIDGVGKQGGMSAVLGLSEFPGPLVARVADRMQRAQLGQISVDWGGQDVYETYPARIPDLWAGSPVVVVGRYRSHGAATVRVTGTAEGRPADFPLDVRFTEGDGAHAVLAKVWARRKIEDLSEQMIVAGDPLEEEITELALQYRLASAFTSFVAVDESEQARLLASPQPPRRVVVPVPLPAGVRYEGIFGRDGDERKEVQEIASLGYAYAPMARGDLSASHEMTVMDASTMALMARVQGGVSGGLNAPPLAHYKGGSGQARKARMAPGTPAATPAPPAPPPPPPVAPARRAAFENRVYAEAGPGAPDVARREEARKDLTRAQELMTRKDWSAARRALQRAWLQEDAYLQTAPWDDGGTRSTIAAEWQALESAYASAQAAADPALARPLDLVIRNADLEAALGTVARAAGRALRVVPGSLEDAMALQRRASLRVAYLDLRRATPAQAFTWLASPFGLEWRLEAGTVVVASARRESGVSAWVYDASDLPPGEGGLATALPALRDAVGGTVSVLGPARLLVEGDAAAQERAARVLASLRTPGAKLPVGLEPWQKKDAAGGTSPAAPETWAEKEELTQAGERLRAFSWPLLATALTGRVDDEAVSELREAWRCRGLAEALSKDRGLVMGARTAWAIAQARRAGPADAELSALADEAYAGLADALRRHGTPPGAGLAPEVDLYLALLRREAGLPAALVRVLPTDQQVLGRARPPFRAVVASLLDNASPAAIHPAFEAGELRGDDAVVLSAWALRLAGGADWSRFRESKASWLRSAGASGAVLRVVNRLDAASLPAARRASQPQPAGADGHGRLPLALGAGVGLAAALVLRWKQSAG